MYIVYALYTYYTIRIIKLTTVYKPEGYNSNKFNSGKDGLLLLDSIQGLQQKSARTWQITALVSMASFFASLSLCAYALSRPSTIPVVVTVNDEGRANYIGRVDKGSFNSGSIPEISRVYQMKRLLTNMYTWTIDKSAQNKYVSEAQAAVQSGAIEQLHSFFLNNNPFEYLGERTKTITINPPLKEADKTYIINFQTEESNIMGYSLSKKNYTSLFTIEFFEVTEKNPLGIYIVNFNIKEIL